MDNIEYKYRPISMWGYFGYQLLYSIPIIGFIILIINAIGHENINVRNYARSFFCGFIIVLVLIVIIITSGIGLSILDNLTN